MPVIEVDGQELEFPDDMSPDAIKQVLRAKFPSPEAPRADPLRGDDKGAVTSGVQGFNSAVPFGNRITAGAAALALSPFAPKGVGISELYSTARANQKATEEANPNSNLAGSVVGIAATLPVGLTKGAVSSTPVIGNLANAATKATTSTGNFIRAGASTGGRIARGSTVAGATGGVYGFGNTKNDLDSSGALDDAALGAGLGAAGGIALPVAGAALGGARKGISTAIKGATAEGPEAQQLIAESMKAKASGLYEQMRNVGATINKQSSADMLAKIDAEVSKKKFIPNLNPKTVAIIEDIREAAAKGDLGVDELDQYRRLLGKVGASEDGVSAGIARRTIDDFVNSLEAKNLSNGSADAVSFLNQGRAQYQQASKFESVADILIKADGDPNKIKAGLTRFLQNDKNTRGWSQNELEALKNAARSGTGEKLLKMGGKFGFDLGTSTTAGNTVAPIVGAVTGGAVGGVTSAGVVPVAGTIARQGQKYMARGKADQLLDALAGKSAPKSLPRSASPATLPGAIGGNAAQAGQPTQISINPSFNPYQGGNSALPQVELPKTVTTVEPLSYNAEMPADNQSAVTPQFMQKMAQVESAGNPNAKATTSSAKGLYQFTNGKWKEMVGKYGEQYGIAAKDIFDPRAQRIMATLSAMEHEQALTSELGRPVNDGDLYAAHFLGLGGAKKLLRSLGSGVSAVQVFPEAARANTRIFYDKMRPRTTDEVYRLLQQKMA